MGSNPVETLAMAMVGLFAAGALLLAYLRYPRLAMAVWAAALFFTPIWLGAQAGIFITALTAVTILAILSGFGTGFRWSHVDTLVVLFFLALFIPLAFGGAVWGHLQLSMTTWILPYIWGRMVLQRSSENWVAACIAAAAGIAAILAIVEFITSTNYFLLIPGASSSSWGNLQVRGGLLRAEGAFGHSIALGCSLAMSTAFILVVKWPVWVRVPLLALVAVATGLTFSRVGIIGLVLTVLLCVVFLGRYLSSIMRISVVVAVGVAAAVGLPLILDVFSAAGEEAEGSAEYRTALLPLMDKMILLGVSPSRQVLASGEDYFGDFRSIDSALILIGLRHGLVPLLLLLILLAIAIGSIVLGRGTPAAIAVVAQIPAFATVALITQYQALIWFAAGLAVASYTLRVRPPAERRISGTDTMTREMAEAP